MRERRTQAQFVGAFPFYLLLVVIIVYIAVPLLLGGPLIDHAGHRALRDAGQYFPSNPTLGNYSAVFSSNDFLRALINSAIVAGSVTILSLALGSLASYALGRFRFRGRTPVLYIMLSMTMFPQIAVLGSLYTLINRFHLYNTLWALILTYMIFTLPFTVWVLTTSSQRCRRSWRRPPTSTARRRSRSSTR